MINSSDTTSWANAEFGGANLHNRRRTVRLVSIAARIAEAPAGRVTEVFPEGAELEGAYRFLENDAVKAGEIGRAALRACLERARGLPFVFVPVDGSSITLTDRAHEKGTGRVGTTSFCARGLEVMSAIAVAPDGTPLGYCA